MSTLTTNAHWNTHTVSQAQSISVWGKWTRFADTQAPRKTFWFLISLVSQGVFFLPVPALLIYYFNAPIVVLAVTLILFFLNFIAGMGGSNIRTTLGLFVTSILIHLLMLFIYII